MLVNDRQEYGTIRNTWIYELNVKDEIRDQQENKSNVPADS